MSVPPSNPAICHITHVRNLPIILREKGLWCDREAAERGVCQQEIAHNHIKQRRAKRKVPVCEQGYLCDYVPFYFWHHSPMLYAIYCGLVTGYEAGQNDVIYLVSSVNRVRERFLFVLQMVTRIWQSQPILMIPPI